MGRVSSGRVRSTEKADFLRSLPPIKSPLVRYFRHVLLRYCYLFNNMYIYSLFAKSLLESSDIKIKHTKQFIGGQDNAFCSFQVLVQGSPPITPPLFSLLTPSLSFYLLPKQSKASQQLLGRLISPHVLSPSSLSHPLHRHTPVAA